MMANYFFVKVQKSIDENYHQKYVKKNTILRILKHFDFL